MQHILQYTLQQHCNTLQHTALPQGCCCLQGVKHTCTHCNTHCKSLQHTTTHFSTLEHTGTHCSTSMVLLLGATSTNCNKIQHILQYTLQQHCNTLQHTALPQGCCCLQGVQHTSTHCNTHCKSLQHTATHCSTLEHTTTHHSTSAMLLPRATASYSRNFSKISSKF